MLRVSVERWLRVMREAPARIRVRESFLEALDLKLRKVKRGKATRQRPSPRAMTSRRGSASRIALDRKFDNIRLTIFSTKVD
jgi:hypothetical protein